jgi:tRNA (guanine-N7-)-methyltransferase
MVRVRPHVNPLKSWYASRRVQRLALPADAEVEVEIGCAEAWFLFDRAALDPSRVEVGLEIRHELIDPVNARAREEGRDVRAIFAHANHDLVKLFAPGRVARVFLNFPDPWFKRRHHKRRVVDAQLVEDIARILRPRGELWFQSDVWDLALDALAEIEARPDLFTNMAGEPWSFWKAGNPYAAMSRREHQCITEGAPVWRMRYLRGQDQPP